MARTLTPVQRMEQWILKDRREAIWRPFMRAVRAYALIAPGDRIAVCVSGGKDSMLLAKLMQMLARLGDTPFEALTLIMDPGYLPAVRRGIEANARRLGLSYALFDSDVFDAASAQDANPCFMCARMRRGCLYGKARALGCNKIALGHHFDDVIETTLMAMLYGGQIQAMPPKLHAANFPGMELIRPLYGVREADILAWRDAFGLEFNRCACPMSAGRSETASRRQSVKRLIARLGEDDPKVARNIFNSIHTVQLDTLVGWKYRGATHSFLDDYGEKWKGIRH